jgi:hypothetical protein
MRQSTVLQLRANQQPTPEGVVLNTNGNWSSPPGGWLPVQSGRWLAVASNINLYGIAGGTIFAQLLQLDFGNSNQGDNGNSLYPENGDGGTWLVTAVSP